METRNKTLGNRCRCSSLNGDACICCINVFKASEPREKDANKQHLCKTAQTVRHRDLSTEDETHFAPVWWDSEQTSCMTKETQQTQEGYRVSVHGGLSSLLQPPSRSSFRKVLVSGPKDLLTINFCLSALLCTFCPFSSPPPRGLSHICLMTRGGGLCAALAFTSLVVAFVFWHTHLTPWQIIYSPLVVLVFFTRCREGYQGIRCDQFLPKTDSILSDPSKCLHRSVFTVPSDIIRLELNIRETEGGIFLPTIWIRFWSAGGNQMFRNLQWHLLYVFSLPIPRLCLMIRLLPVEKHISFSWSSTFHYLTCDDTLHTFGKANSIEPR